MLRPNGSVCLIDFNISQMSCKGPMRPAGISFGYAPPEQCPRDYYEKHSGGKGVPEGLAKIIGRGIDARSDVYGLGATLYFLLTGTNPGCDFGNVAPLSGYGIRISEAFSAVISGMMHPDPDKRYPDGIALLDTLEHIEELDGSYRAWKRAGRIRFAVSLAGLAAGLALVLSGLRVMDDERNLRYNGMVEEAESLTASGDYAAAADLAGSATLLIPSRPEAYVAEAFAMYAGGDYEGCISYASSTVNDAQYALAPGSEAEVAELYYILGNACFETGDYASAASAFDGAVSLDTGIAAYYGDLAAALALSGDPSGAREALDAAISLELGEDSIYMAEGEILYVEGDYPGSAESLAKALALSSSEELSRRCVTLLASVYEEIGETALDEEITLLSSWTDAHPGPSSFPYLEKLAGCYARKGELLEGEEAAACYDGAVSIFESLMEEGCVTGRIMENAALLYEKTDAFGDAERVLLEMAELFPGNYVPYERLAYLEADRQQEKENGERDYGLFMSYYEKALALYDGSASDQEMDMLSAMAAEIKAAGWLEEDREG